MKSDNWIAISELGEEIVRLVNCNTYKHLSATEKTIAICQAFGDITGTIDSRNIAAKSSTPAETASWWMT